MLRKVTLLMLVFLHLSGCAGTYGKLLWVAEPIKHAKGEEEHIYCQNESLCYKAANSLCPEGFNIVERPRKFEDYMTDEEGDHHFFWFKMIAACKDVGGEN